MKTIIITTFIFIVWFLWQHESVKAYKPPKTTVTRKTFQKYINDNHTVRIIPNPSENYKSWSELGHKNLIKAFQGGASGCDLWGCWYE